MRKIVSLLSLSFMLCVGVLAQASFTHTTFNPTGAILNTNVDTLALVITTNNAFISIQPVFTRATGTMAGTAILAYSVNGTQWVNSDTFTLTNAATNSTIWNKNIAARRWRIIRSGATTVTGTSNAKIYTAN